MPTSDIVRTNQKGEQSYQSVEMRVHDIRMIPRLIGQCHSERTPPVQGNPTQSYKVDSNLNSVNTRPGGEPDLFSQQ